MGLYCSGHASLWVSPICIACCIVLTLPLFWACLPLVSPICMACCIVLGLPPSGSPRSVWPAVLFWACLPLGLPNLYGLLYCSGHASLWVSPICVACCIVLGMPPSGSPQSVWPAVLFWACLPLGLPDLCGLLYCSGHASLWVSPICMACCIVLGMPPSGSPRSVWPAVLPWACLPLGLPDLYSLLYCSGHASL